MTRVSRLSSLLGSLYILSTSIAAAADPPKAPATKTPTAAKPAKPVAPAASEPVAPAAPAAPTPPEVSPVAAPDVAPAQPPAAPNAAPPPPPPPAPLATPPKAKKAPPAKAAPPKAAPPPSATAAKPDDAKKAEAAQRFDRGLELFDQGDNAGALAEFKRTYEILPNPMVLYNIGLVYAAMARPVDAVDALEPAIASGGLNAKQLERAKTTLADQKSRIGRLTVTTTPEGARVEVDNVEAATTPLTAPIRISEGSHIVGAVAEGFAPARKEIVVAGNSDASIHLDLVPTQGKALANLTVRGTDGAEVRVDNELSGKTPLETSITLVAGHHVVELKRPGYTTTRREVDVGEGATGDIEIELPVNPSALGREGATMVLDASEGDLTVDGEHRGLYRDPLRLPRGPHHIVVNAAGFIPVERDVNLDSGQTNVIHLDFEPTPEKRASMQSNARFHSTWGWIGVIGGAAIAGGGAALAVVGASQKSDGDNGIVARNNLVIKDKPPCDGKNGFMAEDNQPEGQQQEYLCNKLASDAQNKIDNGTALATAGYVGIGVGGAIAVTGVILLLTGDDPNRYDHPRTRSLGRRAQSPSVAFVPGPGQFGTGLRLAF